jgi:hypothetical protein
METEHPPVLIDRDPEDETDAAEPEAPLELAA